MPLKKQKTNQTITIGKPIPNTNSLHSYIVQVFLSNTNNFQTNLFDLYLPYYLTIDGGRIVGFIPFPRVVALWGTVALSRNWTLVDESISYDSNQYTTALPPTLTVTDNHSRRSWPQSNGKNGGILLVMIKHWVFVDRQLFMVEMKNIKSAMISDKRLTSEIEKIRFRIYQ